MYIQYSIDQLYLPMDLEEDIPQNHLVRIINYALNRIDDHIFAAAYPGGGRNSYHPKMLTKILIYERSHKREVGTSGRETGTKAAGTTKR